MWSEIVYLGLYISMRPLNIDGPSNVLNWVRHSEAAVDVRALSLFCKYNHGDINNGELGNNTCTTMWKFLCTAVPPLIVCLHSSHISMMAGILHSTYVPVCSFHSDQYLPLKAISLQQSNSWFCASRLATIGRWTLLYQTLLNLPWICIFSYYHLKLFSTSLEN